MSNYEDKIKREKNWYLQTNSLAKHMLNTKLFYSPERNIFNYIFPKKQLAKLVYQTARLNRLDNPYILIAPLGVGDDIKYHQHLSNNIYGIDISEEAIDRITDKNVKKYVGDMKNLDVFPTSFFDIVIISLFFHHFLNYGFDNFLSEIYRVLKTGGYLFSLEPSILHPASWITRTAKRAFGNITGQVEDEAPFMPFKLTAAMKRCGFKRAKIYGASFSHNRIPIPIAKLNNLMTAPLLKMPMIKYCAWMCVFSSQK